MLMKGLKMSEQFETKIPTTATIVWQAGDIQGFRPDWTLEQCDEWLSNNRNRIIDRSIELGHEVIETLLEMDDE